MRLAEADAALPPLPRPHPEPELDRVAQAVDVPQTARMVRRVERVGEAGRRSGNGSGVVMARKKGLRVGMRACSGGVGRWGVRRERGARLE